jgi:predicted aspartyl protease
MSGNTFKGTMVVVLLLSAGVSAIAQRGTVRISPENVPGGAGRANESRENGPAGPVPFHLARGVPVVQVVLNGHGPYSFLVDTGTNVTLVAQPVLDQLSVSTQTIVPLHSVTGDGTTSETTLETVAVGGLRLYKLEVGTLKRGQLAIYGDQVQGVLGEDFLKHFDLLLDYQHGVLTLDMSSALADTLMGEHVAFRRSGVSHGEEVPDRILVQSKLPSFNGSSMACLVDSGTYLAVIFLRDGSMERLAGTHPQMNLSSPFGGNSACVIEPSRVEVGGKRVRSTDVLACEDNKQANADSDCLLPTNLFRSVFISHRGGYIVMNPQFMEQASLGR